MKTFILKKFFAEELKAIKADAHRKGRVSGIAEERQYVLERLKHHSVEPFNSDELTLGYEQAVAAIKGILVRH